MTGRERILKVLNRETPDCIPFDIGGTDCSGLHAIPYHRMRDVLELGTSPVRCTSLIQVLGEMDTTMRDALQVDAEVLCFNARKFKTWEAPFGIEMLVPEKFAVENHPDGSSSACNAAGEETHRMAAGGCYFDPVGTPLNHVDDPDQLADYDALFERWDYSPVFDETIDEMAARAAEQYTNTDRAVVASWGLHYLQAGQLMRGYEAFLCDLMVDKNLARAVLDKLHEVYLRRIDTFMSAFGESFDIVFLTDDLGTQQSGLISPTVYEEMIYPYIREVVARIKKHDKKVIMHSCGAVSQFIPYMIEMGIDALNPVQVSAHDMNPGELVRQFGKDIAFWGGGVDTQHALNAADPETVRADVRRRLEEFSGGHLVFTQVHNVQYDVSAENILAMRDEFFKQAR